MKKLLLSALIVLSLVAFTGCIETDLSFESGWGAGSSLRDSGESDGCFDFARENDEETTDETVEE